MTDVERLTGTARQRYSEMDLANLKEMWTADGRAEWAEAALRDELLERGVSEQDLDVIARSRAEIAANAPPSARTTLWNYGVVGRILTLAGMFAWFFIGHAFGASDKVGVAGALVVVGTYVYVLSRRTQKQKEHSTATSTIFAMNWQLTEAWFLLIAIGIVAIAIFVG
ncbi:hypothetical protein [Dyella flagellata]|uniref:DUF2157 domain-containing protein n=1 Tax=Dyella flagellata TaxID=1867833 RepID=A0ABQ5X9G4_9GAMM|nr:hypothetical protein [Dyella flagellata]GLQ88315.1 hypothetical protein GCM10007898_18840 [Dyella flagellata]